MIAGFRNVFSGWIAPAVAACIAALIWYFVADDAVSAPREPFDRQRWLDGALLLQATADPGCARGGMAIDLLDSRVLENLTKESVVNLLGNPNQDAGRTYYYELGQCSGGGWHHSLLILDFSGVGSVARVGLARDAR